jgi:adenylate cyclase
MLVEFPSMIDAVRCAAEMQRTAIDHNEKTTADQRNLFRIGINLSDVIVEENDVFGDGVNIAARWRH